MKKLIIMLAAAVIFAAMTGCTQNGTEPQQDMAVQGGNVQTETVGEAATSPEQPEDENLAEILAMIDMSREEFAAMDPEQQEMLLAELGAVLEDQQNRQEEAAETKTYTPEDVMAGGKYKVVLGDYMNSITLYYEDGKLVKLEESFQKSSEEEVEAYVVEGDALAEYGFNFIDWDGATLQEILDGMKDYGGFGQYTIKAVE